MESNQFFVFGVHDADLGGSIFVPQQFRGLFWLTGHRAVTDETTAPATALLARVLLQKFLDQPAWCTDGSSRTIIDSTLPELPYDFAVRKIERAPTGSGPCLFVHDDGARTSAIVARRDIAGNVPDRTQRNLELQWKSGEAYGRSVRLNSGFECDRNNLVYRFNGPYAPAAGNVDVSIALAFVGVENIVVGAEAGFD
jgi:hypothetical protein